MNLRRRRNFRITQLPRTVAPERRGGIIFADMERGGSRLPEVSVPVRVIPSHSSGPVHVLCGAILTLALLAGCTAPRLQHPDQVTQPPRLATEEAVMDDGYRLPLRYWGRDNRPRAVVLALHGFNDYGNAFATLGPYLAQRGILTYAYDQRGFGATAQRGSWAGTARMSSDLHAVSALLRKRHPGAPFYLLGESMGGAVVMASPKAAQAADGVVLVAPAVWSRDNMNPVQRFALSVAAHTVPWLEVTGEGLDIWPSDNREMLRVFSADPLVIKQTRVNALWGVTNLMDAAVAAAGQLPRPALLLYGKNDQIIPKSAFCAALEYLPEDPRLRVVLYGEGWHMLTRDLQGRRVMEDIGAWLLDQRAPLPSGEEAQPGSKMPSGFCPPRETHGIEIAAEFRPGQSVWAVRSPGRRSGKGDARRSKVTPNDDAR